ncbi:hypothetical protein B9T16_30375, partial [Arthrospira sp. PCC 8006]
NLGLRVVMLKAPAVVFFPNRVPCGPRNTSTGEPTFKVVGNDRERLMAIASENGAVRATANYLSEINASRQKSIGLS